MNSVGKVILVAVAVFVCAGVVAAAEPTINHFTATETVCYVLDPGTVNVTAGMIHVRGQVRKNRVIPTSGETRIDAWDHLVVNLDVDAATLSGRMDGHFMTVPVDESVQGYFAGRFSADITNGLAVGRADGQGFGVFDGLKLSGGFVDVLSSEVGPCPTGVARPFPNIQTHINGQITDHTNQ